MPSYFCFYVLVTVYTNDKSVQPLVVVVVIYSCCYQLPLLLISL